MLKGTHLPSCKNGHQAPERLSNGRCKLCNNDYQRSYMKKRRDKNLVRERVREKAKAAHNREENKTRAFSLLGNKCVDCPVDDSRVLVFDHLRDKVCNVAALLSLSWSNIRLQAELEKCELVCSNCHAIRTLERRQNA